MKLIASRDNAHFKMLRKLCHSSRERRKTGLAVLEGMHLVSAWETRFGKVQEILVSETGLQNAEIAAYLARGERAPTVRLSDGLFAELTEVETPCGILALVQQPRPPGGIDQEADAVLLDGVQDPGNLGSILRTAAAAGFRQVLLSSDCAHAWTPKTLRAGMGAHFLLDIHERVNLPGFLAAYRGTIALTALDAKTSLYTAALKNPVAWVFGSEGQGVRPEVVVLAKLQLRIPMPGGTESLNVAAAAAVCLFETIRQRQQG